MPWAKVSNERGAQYPVHHVRPAARRSSRRYGHPHLATRTLDRSRAAACASRMPSCNRASAARRACRSTRAGTSSSHGATWNRVPSSIGEITLGEYLHDAGRALSLAGKTHVMPDHAGMQRLEVGSEPSSARCLRAGGFVEPTATMAITPSPDSQYAAYLRAQGLRSAAIHGPIS